MTYAAAILSSASMFFLGMALGYLRRQETTRLLGERPEYDVQADPYVAGEYGRLLAARDRLISEGVDPAELLVPEPPR